MNTNLSNTKEHNDINLIADIGGTNIRLAQATSQLVTDTRNIDIHDIETYQCKEFASLADVVAHYIDVKELNNLVINACFAIACPVDNDLISMTNLPWQFSQNELKQSLNLHSLRFINDYTAIAMAIPLLSEQQKIKIEQWHCISGEGGHIDFAPVDEVEQQVMNYIQGIKKRVSYEQLLSGYGLEQIYQALLFINQGKEITRVEDKLTAKDITANALNSTCAVCEQTLALFCDVLGSFAGNLALIMNSQGGVYIAGGIVPRFVDYLKLSDFRARFETKGRLSSITEQAPTYVITEEQPGLLGAAAFVVQK